MAFALQHSWVVATETIGGTRITVHPCSAPHQPQRNGYNSFGAPHFHYTVALFFMFFNQCIRNMSKQEVDFEGGLLRHCGEWII